SASYTDRVVHHALCNVLEPQFERRFIYDSYACRRGKGTMAALQRAHKFCRQFPYVLKLDIQKYFPSIDHEILFESISATFKDPRILGLVDLIIRRHDAPQSPPRWFPGDDLLTPGERPRGLPIGNQTSQLFGNVMLDPLDHYIKECLCVRGYVRYADDMLVFGASAAELHSLRPRIQNFLAGRRLNVNARKCQVFPCRNGVPFLGARLFPRSVKMSRRLIRRFRRRALTMQRHFQQGRISLQDIQPRIVSWLGHVRHLAPDTFLGDLLESLALSR
ncbi:MAG: reverse transcriptase domain-containing protein, partial [Planctomycetaceae bacterium]